MGNCPDRFTTVDDVLLGCRPGDLIEILHAESTFNHWAVYVGDGTVVHVRQPWIRRESLQSAVGPATSSAPGASPGQTRPRLARINNRKHRALGLTAQSPDKIVDTAHEQLGVEWYNMQLYGCEMFAIRCRFGVKVDVRKELYKSTEIDRPSDSTVALCNPLATYGHQQHEF